MAKSSEVLFARIEFDGQVDYVDAENMMQNFAAENEGIVKIDVQIGPAGGWEGVIG